MAVIYPLLQGGRRTPTILVSHLPALPYYISPSALSACLPVPLGRQTGNAQAGRLALLVRKCQDLDKTPGSEKRVTRPVPDQYMPYEFVRSIQNTKNKININFVPFVLFVVNHCFLSFKTPPPGETPPAPLLKRGEYGWWPF